MSREFSGNNSSSVYKECYRTRSEMEKFNFAWIIESFSFCCVFPSDNMTSAKFPNGRKTNCCCYLMLNIDITDIHCYLYFEDVSVQMTVKGTVSFNTSAYSTIDKREFSKKFYVDSRSQYVSFMFDRAKILQSLKADDILKVCVKIAARVNTVSDFDRTFVANKQELTLSLAADISSLFTDPKHSDVVISVQGKLIKAHVSILSARSNVFDAMFRHNTIEKTSKVVKIGDFDFDTIYAMVRFMYTGMPPENFEILLAMNLLGAADKYAMDSLKNICADYLMCNLNTSNVQDVLRLADIHNIENLKAKSVDFIFANREFFDCQQHGCTCRRNEIGIVLRTKNKPPQMK